MSDQKLRDLERRWKETGSPDSEAAYLLERVRVGDLSRERLVLAAHCGHSSARSALQTDLDAQVKSTQSITDFVSAVAKCGKEGTVAAAALAAISVESLAPNGCGCQDALARALDWLRCPCSDHAVAARAASQVALSRVAALPNDRVVEKCSGGSLTCSAEAAASRDPTGVARVALQSAANARQGRLASPETFLAEIRDGLIRWALTGTLPERPATPAG